jgi:hypothetical protein
VVLEVLHVGVAETFAAAVAAAAVAVAVAVNVAVAIAVATGEAVVGGPHGSRCVVRLMMLRLMMLLRLMLMLPLLLLLLLMLESVRVLELMVRGVSVRRPVLPVGAQRGVHRGAGGRSVVAAAVPISVPVSILVPVAAMLVRDFPCPFFESPHADDVLLPRRRPQHQPARWHAVRRPFCPFHANVHADRAVVLVVARASARVHHRAGAVGTVPWRVHRGPERPVVHVHRMRRRRVARHPVAGIRHAYHGNNERVDT